MINLGSDRPVVLDQALQMIKEMMGKKGSMEYMPRHPSDVLARWADISKARELLNWKPETSFEEGLRELVNCYCEHQTWLRKIECA